MTDCVYETFVLLITFLKDNNCTRKYCARFFFFTLRVQEINFFVCSQALVREQQKTQEVGRLQEVINKILREAGKRTREEVIVRRI